MRGSHAPSPAERLLAEIYEAGYSSVDDFIDRLRIRPRRAGSVHGRHAAPVDPFDDTVELHLPLESPNPLAGLSHWYPEAGRADEVDPTAVTTEFPAIQRIWVIPERHAS
ncbi:hypothetical protein [Nocardia veterana]|uniref:Uncharacterized protein n=1 Tax=Nocardia veterana TaxID=132249 RepID=A0A7X6LZP1_9NOCA|nr:hypothetical protein [Nocardia veterana]NKY86727.1 hypothetical protein [Nocardia veterana]